ncbi:glutamate-1-semialdehyde 2,1-aminomutase [Janibacter sp. GS2]|uniref:glutamate-1-semialdehyde 2,1-aminomutase n=1 Tax=Janibacter sp. GS2 TaxID=3442646 RepID=UPI003EBF944B
MSPAREIRSSTSGSERAAAALAWCVPGGAHTYAKGQDQYPEDRAPIIARGLGSHVWDVDGHEYVEYGSGLRSVVLGHAHPLVNERVAAELAKGVNFARPSIAELAAAEDFLTAVPTMEMVKFAKNGSDATTAAVRLARAVTGRDVVAICGDHPFFSTDDWFIATTGMPAGIPRVSAELTTSFPYGDLDGLREALRSRAGQVAAVVLEVETMTPAPDGYLDAVVDLAHDEGALVIVDEMITGFRWDLAGAHALRGMRPDLVTFGKAMANGFSVSALAGRRDIMERGGPETDEERVFLLSTTHGGETHSLAAFRACVEVQRQEGTSARLLEIGGRLRRAVEEVVADAGLSDRVVLRGRDCNLVFATLDETGAPSQEYRTLFMRGLLRRGVIAPSFVVSSALDAADIEVTAQAVRETCIDYAAALDRGDPSPWMGGRSIRPVFSHRR